MSRNSAVREASFNPSITFGLSMNPNDRISRNMPATDRGDLDALSWIHTWRIGADGRDQQHALMQNAIVLQVMGQAERDAGAGRGEDGGRPGSAQWRVGEDPSDKLVFALPKFGASALEQQPTGSPGQHEGGDTAGQDQREPASLEQFGGIGSDKEQLNGEVETRSRPRR